MPISRYSMENDNINPINAKLLYVTHSVYENDWPSLPHTHYFTELCYIKRGKGNYLIEDQIYPVKEDDFIIINSNITHTERSVGDIPLEYIILGVEGLNFSFEGDHEHIIFSCRNDHARFMYHMNGLLTEMEEKRSTGIGLFLCRQAMDMLGQSIEIESEEGKGTRVILGVSRKKFDME